MCRQQLLVVTVKCVYMYVYVYMLLHARLCLFPGADRIEAVRRELARYNINSDEAGTIQCLELLGEGTYGKVGGW